MVVSRIRKILHMSEKWVMETFRKRKKPFTCWKSLEIRMNFSITRKPTEGVKQPCARYCVPKGCNCETDTVPTRMELRCWGVGFLQYIPDQVFHSTVTSTMAKKRELGSPAECMARGGFGEVQLDVIITEWRGPTPHRWRGVRERRSICMSPEARWSIRRQ